ncbi:MAG: AIR synthase family protein [Planctomycetota bacterium]
MLGPGKLDAELLARLLKTCTGKADPRVAVGPGVGADAAVIDMGDKYLVAATDPVSFATAEIGWYAVHVNANDIACMGAKPLWFLVTVLLPAGSADEKMAGAIAAGVHEAADGLGVAVVGGHTEVTPGIDRPILAGTMIGEAAKDRLVRPGGAREGDAVILTKGLAIEATAVIAREKRADLEARGFAPALLDRCAGYLRDPGISVVRDARIATAAGHVHALHDPTEGGVAAGLGELAQAAGLGIEADGDMLAADDETRALCGAYGIDPLHALSSGALLIALPPDDVDTVKRALAAAGIRSAVVARMRPAGSGMKIRTGGTVADLAWSARDEIGKLFA